MLPDKNDQARIAQRAESAGWVERREWAGQQANEAIREGFVGTECGKRA